MGPVAPVERLASQVKRKNRRRGIEKQKEMMGKDVERMKNIYVGLICPISSPFYIISRCYRGWEEKCLSF